MKNYLLAFAMFLTISAIGQNGNKRALLIIDIQEFYFPGGFSELHEPEVAAKNAAKVLEEFRQNGELVVHIQHKTDTQMAISPIVKPTEKEKIVVKSEVSCFNGTGLQEFLKEDSITNLVIVGMQTHMCVEGATRAGYDLGYKIELISDACTTKDLKWNDKVISWEKVHFSTLSTLKSYAEIFTFDEWINIK